MENAAALNNHIKNTAFCLKSGNFLVHVFATEIILTLHSITKISNFKLFNWLHYIVLDSEHLTL